MTLLTEAKLTLDKLREILEFLNDDELLKDDDYEKYYQTNEINLISIPSIFFGEAIKKGSVNASTESYLEYINQHGKLPSSNDARKRRK